MQTRFGQPASTDLRATQLIFQHLIRNEVHQTTKRCIRHIGNRDDDQFIVPIKLHGGCTANRTSTVSDCCSTPAVGAQEPPDAVLDGNTVAGLLGAPELIDRLLLQMVCSQVCLHESNQVFGG